MRRNTCALVVLQSWATQPLKKQPKIVPAYSDRMVASGRGPKKTPYPMASPLPTTDGKLPEYDLVSIYRKIRYDIQYPTILVITQVGPRTPPGAVRRTIRTASHRRSSPPTEKSRKFLRFRYFDISIYRYFDISKLRYFDISKFRHDDIRYHTLLCSGIICRWSRVPAPGVVRRTARTPSHRLSSPPTEHSRKCLRFRYSDTVY